MTPSTVPPGRQWVISTRADGEVLVARAGAGPVSILLLTGPTGYSAAEIEAWLGDLIGVANESGDAGPAGPIAPLLHRVLTGLLFSHAELWERTPAHQPCSFAWLADDGATAFGWVGNAEVRVWTNDHLVSPAWVRVRDSEQREAHALSFDPGESVRLQLSWESRGEDGATRRADVTAEWHASRPALATDAEAHPTGASGEAVLEAMPAAAYGASPSQEAGGPPVRRPAWQFRSWVNLLGLGSAAQQQEMGEAAPPAAIVRATDDRAEADVRATDDRPVADAPADTPPQAGEPAGDLIPPTPEPESLTALTVPLAEPDRPETPACSAPEPDRPEALASPPPEPADELTVARAEPPSAEPIAGDASSPGTMPVHESDVDSPLAAAGFLEPDLESPPRRAARRPVPVRSWPEEPETHVPWRSASIAALIVVLLFALGWVLGTSSSHERGAFGALARAIDGLGLGPGRFTLAVDSQPQGAWITVDGKALGQRTPASTELRPGPHEIALGLPGLGGASYSVRGRRGEHVPLTGQLFGSLAIGSADPGVAVTVSVDEVARGPVPVTVDGLAPGIHKVEFTAPGIGGWEQTAEVRIHETSTLIAHPLATAPTGILEVRALLSAEGAPQPVSGARVWVDGEPRGVTPLQVELPRGPHSVRVTWRSTSSGIQVIELPGGNTRFASFDLDADVLPPRVVVAPLPGRIPHDPPAVVSASLQGIPAADVREMWLHVSTPEGAWRRYPMNLLRSPGSAAGAAVFPLGAFDARGRARWYVSALVAAGDEYFTEIQTAQADDR